MASYFWRTATNNVMTLPVVFPDGADSATLAVTGLSYTASYPGITTNEFTLTLPPAGKPSEENVYDLTLTFNDGTVRFARLGLIQGLSPDAEGVTRCIAPAQGKVWNTATDRAVLPIPYGTTSFTVNGVEHDTGLDGAQGWYALSPIERGETITLSCLADGVSYAASILGGGNGFMLIYK